MDNNKHNTGGPKNVYKEARLRAAQSKPELKNQEDAATALSIQREKLGKIEQTDRSKKQTIPNTDDVERMIKVYDAPELRNYFCTHHCPLGAGLPVLEHDNPERISLRLLVALHRIEQFQDELADILVDGTVAEAERAEFQKIVETLKNIASQANSLELWAQKNGLL